MNQPESETRNPVGLQIRILSGHPGLGDKYKVLLGPGHVRYIYPKTFFLTDVEDVIAEINELCAHPEIRSPEQIQIDGRIYSYRDLDELVQNESWETKLRVHSALGKLLIERKMPWDVYCQFHAQLGLGNNFAIEKCAESWVEGTQYNFDLADSYRDSKEHLVTPASGCYCVYQKTDFVTKRLSAIARETEEQAEQAEKQRAAVALETLRKSRFETFLYIMEDLRNGAFKIGHSKTPAARERTLQSEVPEVTLRLSIPADQAHEKLLHDHFSGKRQRGEWFSLTADDLLWLVSFLKENGDVARVSADYEWLGRLHFQSSDRSNRPGES